MSEMTNITVRQWAREGHRLDGADAQALEGALSQAERELAALKELIAKSQLVEVDATKVAADGCGAPILRRDGKMLVPHDQQSWMQEHTRMLQQFANTKRDLAAMTKERDELRRIDPESAASYHRKAIEQAERADRAEQSASDASHLAGSLLARAEAAEARLIRPVDTGDCSTCDNLIQSGICRLGNDTRRASCCYHSRAGENDTALRQSEEIKELQRALNTAEARLKRAEECIVEMHNLADDDDSTFDDIMDVANKYHLQRQYPAADAGKGGQ